MLSFAHRNTVTAFGKGGPINKLVFGLSKSEFYEVDKTTFDCEN